MHDSYILFFGLTCCFRLSLLCLPFALIFLHQQQCVRVQWASYCVDCAQALGVVAAGSLVSALLISDLANIPVPLEVPTTRAPTHHESC